MKERLHKILARSTELSLRAAEKAIAAGEVSVNRVVVTKLGVQVDPDVDEIQWKGKKAKISSERLYLIYNKPTETLVTKHDPLGRRTIWEDLKSFKEKVNAVGRLDYDSEGLLLLTNDGALLNRLIHPKHEVRKVYLVKVKGFPKKEDLDRLRRGVTFRSVNYQPAKMRVSHRTQKNLWIEVEIAEGKNRQVRKMFTAISHSVLKLKRMAIGPISLGDLRTGKWRFLRREEVVSLLKL